MRADEGAGVALDALVGLPDGDVDRYAALLVGCGACGHGAVHPGDEGAHGQGVAALGVDYVGNLLDKGRSKARGVGIDEPGAYGGPFGGNLDLGVFASAVDGGVVHGHDVFALLAIALEGRILHVLDSVLGGDDAGDAEECALEDGVGAAAQTDFGGYLGGVDDVEADVLAADDSLDVVGDALKGFFLVPEGVEQEAAAFLDALEDVVLLEVGGDVAGYEVGGADEVRGLDGGLAEAEVRTGVAAALLGVVVEVGLGIQVGVGADDLDGVLVGADGAVGAEAVELALGGAGLDYGDFFLDGEALEGDVVGDADGEVGLGGLELEVVEYCDDLGGGGVLGGQAVAAAYDQGSVLLALEEGLDVEE